MSLTPVPSGALVALWEHDTFPYLLGGHVTRMNEGGRVETVEFGSGNWFNPIRLLPATSGKEVLVKLDILRHQEEAARREFNQHWRDQVCELVPALMRKRKP